MIFAGDNKGWLPYCSFSAGSTNQLNGVYDTCYIFFGAGANTKIPTSAPAQGSYENEGYLYQAGVAGNGSIFYCPAQWAGIGLGADSFSPLLTANSKGSVLSSYYYNPRVVNASSNPLRRYQTTSQMEPHRLFSMDVLGPITGNNLSGGMGLPSTTIAHARERGWNVLFTDDSVEFARLTENSTLLNLLRTELVSTSNSQFDTVYNALEQDADLGL